MKNKKILMILLILIISNNLVLALAKKEKTSEGDKVPATITKEYRNMTLELMKILDYYDGYQMVNGKITSRLRLYDPNMDKSFSDAINKSADNSAYLDSLVSIYSRYFSLNDLKVLHKYFFSPTFKKAEILGMKIQNEVYDVLDQIETNRKEEIKNMYLKAGRKLPEFLETQQPDNENKDMQSDE